MVDPTKRKMLKITRRIAAASVSPREQRRTSQKRSTVSAALRVPAADFNRARKWADDLENSWHRGNSAA